MYLRELEKSSPGNFAKQEIRGTPLKIRPHLSRGRGNVTGHQIFFVTHFIPILKIWGSGSLSLICHCKYLCYVINSPFLNLSAVKGCVNTMTVQNNHPLIINGVAADADWSHVGM